VLQGLWYEATLIANDGSAFVVSQNIFEILKSPLGKDSYQDFWTWLLSK
jgi:hypothetical protein